MCVRFKSGQRERELICPQDTCYLSTKGQRLSYICLSLTPVTYTHSVHIIRVCVCVCVCMCVRVCKGTTIALPFEIDYYQRARTHEVGPEI